MEATKFEKLERYLKNAEEFFWVLKYGNRDDKYEWLENMGFTFKKGTYAHVIRQLLEKHGIEVLVRRIVIPRVKETFTPPALEYLKACWREGTRPDILLLKHYNIEDPFPFLEINQQYNYVKRWGEFAGLWFEEMGEL